MFVQDVIELTREFYKSHRLERDEILKQNQTKTFNNLASRGLLISKIAADDIGKLYGEELKARTKNAWNYLQKIFERQDVFFTTDEMEKIKEEIWIPSINVYHPRDIK